VLGGAAILASALSLVQTGLFVFLVMSPRLAPVVVRSSSGQALLNILDFWPRPLAVLGIVLGLVALGLVGWDVRHRTREGMSPGGQREARKVQWLAWAAVLLGVALLPLWYGIDWLISG
jgi:hypothetical protein